MLCKKSGGNYYHKKNWVENVEMLLVAAIVILGIRSFFVQPFIIPTNSMYPSFYGMTPHIYEDDNSLDILQRAADKVLLGASHYGWKPNLAELYIWFCKMGRATLCTKQFPQWSFFRPANNGSKIYLRNWRKEPYP